MVIYFNFEKTIKQVLREHDIDFNATDNEGNTALHVRCYGEYGKTTDTECIASLVSSVMISLCCHIIILPKTLYEAAGFDFLSQNFL